MAQMGNKNKSVNPKTSGPRLFDYSGNGTNARPTNVKVTNGMGPREMTGSMPKLKRTPIGKTVDGIFNAATKGNALPRKQEHLGSNYAGNPKDVD